MISTIRLPELLDKRKHKLRERHLAYTIELLEMALRLSDTVEARVTPTQPPLSLLRKVTKELTLLFP